MQKIERTGDFYNDFKPNAKESDDMFAKRLIGKMFGERECSFYLIRSSAVGANTSTTRESNKIPIKESEDQLFKGN